MNRHWTSGIVRTLAVAHQFLTKPCDPRALTNVNSQSDVR